MTEENPEDPNAELRHAFEQFRRDLKIRFGCMMVAFVCVVLAALRYLPRYR